MFANKFEAIMLILILLIKKSASILIYSIELGV